MQEIDPFEMADIMNDDRAIEEQRVPTTEKLAQALSLAGAPKEMIEKAQTGRYDDWKSKLASPIMTLVQEARIAKLPPEFIERVKNGKFDAQEWEAEEWAEKEGIFKPR